MATDAQQLRQRFLLLGAGTVLALLLLLAVVAGNAANAYLRQQAQDRGRDVVIRAASAVTAYLHERRREAEALAASPSIVAVAKTASQNAVKQKLPQYDVPTLERLFSRTRELGGGPDVGSYLTDYTSHSDFVRILLTESHGYSVMGSERAAAFAHGDEPWWQSTWSQGEYVSSPESDRESGVLSMEYDVVVRPNRMVQPSGVLKAVFPLEQLRVLIAGATLGDRAYLEVVDNRGAMVTAPNGRDLLKIDSIATSVPRADTAVAVSVSTAQGDELVTAAPTNDGAWRVLLRQPAAKAYAGAAKAQRAIWLGALALLLVSVGMLWGLGGWLNQRVTEPVREAGRIAGRIAAGDLSVTVAGTRERTAEVAELISSIQSMVVALRRLVGAIRSAADESAAMASE
ncbi:MAG TPA: methyl-accepting chemotaxis protein, partial [Gemmatimonadales bacterium]|nr:methyl-accepting chemotaxis protein [Gemmatimonadales bacterium]